MINYRRLFIIILTVVTVFRLFFNISVPLSGDEAYHWEWSRHLDWGYYDHPPLTGWIIFLFTLIGGSNLFSIRLGALLLTTGAAVLIYLLAKGIFRSDKAAFYAGLLVIITPVFALGAALMSTDPALGFFWPLYLLLVYKAIFEERKTFWYLSGIALGLSLLSKFIGVMLVPSLFLFLILSKKRRKWIYRKEPYLAALVALAIFSPVIWWNAGHNWATFMFHLAKRHHPAGFTSKYLIEYIVGQAVAVSPFMYLTILAALGVAAWRGIKKQRDDWLFLFSFSIVILAFFCLVSLRTRTGAHWPAVGYLTAFVAVAGLFDGFSHKKEAGRLVKFPHRRFWRVGKFYRFSFIFSAAISVALVAFCYAVPLLAPIIPANLAYYGRPDKIHTGLLKELYGWKELGREVDKVKIELEIEFELSGVVNDMDVLAVKEGRDVNKVKLEISGESSVFIITGSYAFSSMIAFYTPGQPYVRLFGRGSVHGRNFAYWDNFEELAGQNAVFVSKRPLNKSVRKRHLLEASFKKLVELPPFNIFRNGRLVRSFYLTKCYGFKNRAIIPTVQ